MTDLATHLNDLAALACPEGGWGYAPGQQPHLEPTCLALLALAADRERYAAAITAGQAWLEQCAVGDGPYRLERGRYDAAWPTALVLFTRAELGVPLEQLDRTARALLGFRGRPSDKRGEEEIH